MSDDLIIIGCGGFGREVFSLVEQINDVHDSPWRIRGFVDDTPSSVDLARVRALGSCVLGTVGSLLRDQSAPAVVLAIGAPAARAAVCSRLDEMKLIFPTFVHPAATVGRAVSLGDGVVIAAGARISTSTSLGSHVHVDQNATIGHDAEVGDYARLNPQACISGSVRIGAAALIGANATVLQGLRIGAGATVGAHACVVRDVPSGAVVKGVPAR